MPILHTLVPRQALLTHQIILLAGFPSLGLGLGALAPEEGRIAWGDKRLWSEGAWAGGQGPRAGAAQTPYPK